MTHILPDSALDDRLAFVGITGSGKTYAACGFVERLLAKRARCVIVDPLDVWWGLRLLADGKTASPWPVVIFGGRHGDLPLTENAGALLGEAVASMAESSIVSLGGLPTKSAERRFMLAFLDAVYRKTDVTKSEPYHIVFDEADLWAPQRALEPALQSRMEEIVRRGRVKGFIPWLITQRPAVLSKDVLSQADGASFLSPRFQARVRESGRHRYQLIGRPTRSKRKAFRLLAEEFSTCVWKHGDVLAFDASARGAPIDPLVLAEIERP